MKLKHFRGFVPDHSRHGYVLDVFIIATIPDCGKFPIAIPTCHAMLSSDETDWSRSMRSYSRTPLYGHLINVPSSYISPKFNNPLNKSSPL